MSRHFRLTSSTETEYDTRDFPPPFQARQFSGADDCYEAELEDGLMARMNRSPSYHHESRQCTRSPSYYYNSVSPSNPQLPQEPIMDGGGGWNHRGRDECRDQMRDYQLGGNEYQAQHQPVYNKVRRPRSASIPFVLDNIDTRPSSSSRLMDRVLVEQDSITSPTSPEYERPENNFDRRPSRIHVPHAAGSPESPSGRVRRPRARTLESLFASRHNRSQSYRATNSARTSSETYDDIENEFFRPRVSTMPSCGKRPSPSGDDGQFYLMRNFSHNEKGQVVNRGDFYREGSRSNTSVCSSSSNKSSPPVAPPENEGGPPLRVMMLGGVGVGKSSLVSQFMCSEFVNAYEYSCDEEEIRPVSVLLDDDEYYLCFIDHPICSDLSHPGTESDNGSEADAYLVVFSTTDHSSFEKAITILKKLKQRGDIHHRAVILVANKCDLVRSREVTEHEAKEVACKFECKYSEISAGMDHNVDELLVGLVTQIKLKADQEKSHPEKEEASDSKGRRHSKTSLFLGNRTRCFFEKLFGKGEHIKSRSCDNLQEL